MSNIKKCDYFIEQMNMHLDGMLSGDEQNELAEHLDTCNACKTRFDSFSAILAERDALVVEPPSGLHAGIMAHIAADKKRRRNRKIIRFTGIAAACAAAVVFVLSGPFAITPPANEMGEMRTMTGYDLEMHEDESDMMDSTGVPSDAVQQGDMFMAFDMPENIDVPAGYAGYCVAVGSGDHAFSIEETVNAESNLAGNAVLIKVENNADAIMDTYSELALSGYELYEEVRGVPEADIESDVYLFVVLIEAEIATAP